MNTKKVAIDNSILYNSDQGLTISNSWVEFANAAYKPALYGAVLSGTNTVLLALCAILLLKMVRKKK